MNYLNTSHTLTPTGKNIIIGAMKKQNLFIFGASVLLGVFFFSCKKNDAGKNEADKQPDVSVENQSQQPQESISETVVDEEDEVFELEIFDPRMFPGTYLPAEYIKALMETKSHLKASQQFISNNEDKPCALYFRQDSIDPVWNFHEGSSEKIVSFTEELLVTDAYGTQKNYIPAGINSGTLTLDGTEYIQISHDCDYPFTISEYITCIILGDLNLTDGSKNLICHDGEISYMGNNYRLGTELFFASKVYDTLAMQSEPYEERFLEILDDRINIYCAIIPEEYMDHPLYIDYAQYQLESSFMF